ncbi:MAG: nucleoside monophosphate kinase [Patescibacteria group bacterium]
MKILLIGPAGSGKGTIGEMVSDYLNISQVSLGHILREVPESHRWYRKINEQMDEGMLVDQDKAAALLKEELEKEKYTGGFVLDGWFRSMENVRLYVPEIDKAFYLSIPRDESVKRLTSRRTCEKCGDIYNIYFSPPREAEICDECGGKLRQRDDDTLEAINERLDIFEEETVPVIEYLKEKGILIEINGLGSPQEVFERVKSVLGI